MNIAKDICIKWWQEQAYNTQSDEARAKKITKIWLN
jgi:hypothetical protein